MINDITGEEFILADQPHFSPDGRYIAAVSAACDHLDSLNGIEIWRVEPNSLSRVFWWEPAEYGQYEFVGWNDSSRLELIFNDCRRSPPAPVYVVNTGSMWRLEGGAGAVDQRR